MTQGDSDTPIVMIHGNYSCGIAFERIMIELVKHTRVIAPCMRGYGYSSYNREIESVHDLVKDVKMFIEDVLKLKRFYILGHSFGCLIAAMLALKMKKQVAGMIMINSYDI